RWSRGADLERSQAPRFSGAGAGAREQQSREKSGEKNRSCPGAKAHSSKETRSQPVKQAAKCKNVSAGSVSGLAVGRTTALRCRCPSFPVFCSLFPAHQFPSAPAVKCASPAL